MGFIAPQALKGVRVVDLTWMLASAGGATMLASLGAEVIRIEWPGHLDFTRFGAVAVEQSPSLGPVREPASSEQPATADARSPNLDGTFNDRNAGKMGVTLNLNHPRGRELFARLVSVSDVVMEGFTAPTMSRWGLHYEGLKTIKRDIIYIPMAGFGNSGPYRQYVSYGPTAQAMAGLAYKNGLPEPHPPTMWNHSYMDVTPPYYTALGVIGAIYYRNRTGKGQYLDQAQYAPGLFLTGTSILEYSANNRRSERVGNRSVGRSAAPHGVYRCAGDDAWIAIAVFSDEEWRALCRAMGDPPWSHAPEYRTLQNRIRVQDELDEKIEAWTGPQERYDLMYRLQALGVPAGVVQSNRDKVEEDPQLKVRDFFAHVYHSELGTRPVTRHFTPKLSLTPAHPGGLTQRGAPLVGEDSAYVYREILGLSVAEVEAYREEGVI